jgi:hypothetical protein
MEQIKLFIEWTIVNLPHIALAVGMILGGIGVIIEALMLLVPTEDKRSALEKALKKVQYLGVLVSKITNRLPSNIKKKKE